MLLRLALASLWSRRLPVALTVAAVALATLLVLAVERLRVDARTSFERSISGTDLIVGARSNPLQLLLASVYRIGDPTQPISWRSFEKISAHPAVRWAVPLTLGDSHRGFRVVGTRHDYFERLRYGDDRHLELAAGRVFEAPLELVLGAEAAGRLGYGLGASVTLAHGLRDDGFSRHEHLAFRVVGILAPTGTPVDQALHVPLAGIEAVHHGWEAGVPDPEQLLHAEDLHGDEPHDLSLEPEQISAFLLGLRSRAAALEFQRAVQAFPDEPLTAVLPGRALRQLWSLFSVVESVLLLVTLLCVITGLLGLAVSLLATLAERRREMAVLRAVGARPLDVAALLVFEASVIGLAGALTGYLLLTLLSAAGSAALLSQTGVLLSQGLPSLRELSWLALVWLAAALAGSVPALRAYRLSLHDGLQARA